MNGLQTSRVVVIDDDATEAVPVIKSLGRLGIGCTYIPGDKFEELPEKPMQGVRLVFLDMQLGTAGTERVVSVQTAKVFSHVIAVSTEPILVVLWTKHPEYVAAFKDALFEGNPAYRSGLLVSAIEKPALSTDIDIEKILLRLRELLKEHSPVETIWFWEQIVHDAATETTGALTKIVSARANIQASDDDAVRMTKWKIGLSHIYRSLLQAVAGKEVDVNAAFGHLLQAMAQLHQDRVESQLLNYLNVDMNAIFSDLVKWQGPSDEERTTVNTMFLTGPVSATDVNVQAGNVYTPVDSEKCPHKLSGLSARSLVPEILKLRGDEKYKQALENEQKYKLRKESAGEDAQKEKENAKKQIEEQEKMSSREREILEQCLPALAELTPSCDYSQKNCFVARFSAGLFVPFSDSAGIRKLVHSKKESLRIIEPIRISGQNGAWWLVLSARFPITVIDPSRIATKPIFRLRTSILLDIQNWFSSQSARPGYVKMEEEH